MTPYYKLTFEQLLAERQTLKTLGKHLACQHRNGMVTAIEAGCLMLGKQLPDQEIYNRLLAVDYELELNNAGRYAAVIETEIDALTELDLYLSEMSQESIFYKAIQALTYKVASLLSDVWDESKPVYFIQGTAWQDLTLRHALEIAHDLSVNNDQQYFVGLRLI
jgi:hypothetical protein